MHENRKSMWAYIFSLLGSRASRIASPSKLKESTTRISDSDGIRKYVGSLMTYLIESEIKRPHVAAGG
jgi:hypothetical protein